MFIEEPFDPNPAITRWFGQAWPSPGYPAPVCADVRYRIDPPVGESCLGCDEPILAGESGVRTPLVGFKGRPWAYQHAECMLRTVMCPEDLGMGDGTHSHRFENRREEGRMLMRHLSTYYASS